MGEHFPFNVYYKRDAQQGLVATFHRKKLEREREEDREIERERGKKVKRKLLLSELEEMFTLTFGGPWMQGHILRISVLSAAYDGAACHVRCHPSGMCCPGRKKLRLHSSKTRCSYLST